MKVERRYFIIRERLDFVFVIETKYTMNLSKQVLYSIGVYGKVDLISLTHAFAVPSTIVSIFGRCKENCPHNGSTMEGFFMLERGEMKDWKRCAVVSIYQGSGADYRM